ncbi:MAG: hypothetical protein QM651_01410 [Rhodoblastus sp.]
MLKSDIDERKAKLAKIIGDLIASEPIERGGLKWAAVHQDELAKHLGVDRRTLHRWTNARPFQREIGRAGEHPRATLLRLLADGETPTQSPETLANIMRKIWEAKVGTALNGKQHGCLIGLAKEWPDGHQLEIFKCVLNDWKRFVVATRHLMDVAAEFAGEDVKQLTADDGKPAIRKMKFPSSTYMRVFADVAVCVYAHVLQAKQKPLPAAVKAIYKSLPL